MFVFVSVCANGVVPFVANFFVVRTQSRDVQMFDVATAEVKNTLRGHQASVNCCCVHPSLPMAFTGADDCSILAWVPQTRTAATAAATTAGGGGGFAAQSRSAGAASGTQDSDSGDAVDEDNWSD